MAALAGLPLVLETAIRLRAVPHSELAEFRRGWAGVQTLLIANPTITASTVVTTMDFLSEALPEVLKVQPRGVTRSIHGEGTYLHTEFARDLGGLLGFTQANGKMRRPRCAPRSSLSRPSSLRMRIEDLDFA